MFKTTSSLRVAAAAIAAAMATAVLAASAASSAGPPTQAPRQLERQDLVGFAECMRSHGLRDFPAPISPDTFKRYMLAGSVGSPAFQSAQTDCQHLLPGEGMPSVSAAQRQAQIVAARAFAGCLRSHGFPRFPNPTPSGELTHEMLANAGIDVHQPKLLQAADACVSVTHGLLTQAAVARFAAEQSSPSSTSTPTQVPGQFGEQDLTKFAECMRSRGLRDFPAAISPDTFKRYMLAGSVGSPAFQSAQTDCQRLLPGEGMPRVSAAQRQAQIVAARAFAGCLRSHGFPSFPNPTPSGELTHEMLANAGIDVHQPELLQAADACVGVTHGLLTQAGVARFVAGQ